MTLIGVHDCLSFMIAKTGVTGPISSRDMMDAGTVVYQALIFTTSKVRHVTVLAQPIML